MVHGVHSSGTSEHLHTSVAPGVAVVSFVAAAIAAFIALELAARTLRAPARQRRVLVLLSGLTMGGGIWAMHFLAMVGLRIDASVTYRLDLVVLSVVFATAGSTAAVALVARPRVTRGRVVLAASCMGFAVSAMHYTGMASLHSPAAMSWDVPLVGLSMLIGFLASLLALGSVASMQGERNDWSTGGRLLAAVVLGVAVAGLHYTGMAAVTFHRGELPSGHAGLALSTQGLAAVLGGAASVLLVVLAVDGGRLKRRADLAGDLAVLARVSRDIGRRGDARRTVCIAATELIGCDVAMLFEPDGDGHLVARASSGDDLDARVAARPGTSIGARIIREGRTRFLADIRTDPHHDPSIVERTGVTSVLFVPVLLDDRPIAVLTASWTARVDAPGDRRLAIAELLAAEAAVAIERADLLARLRQEALVDGLTGLPNRRALDGALDDGLARAARGGGAFTVAMADVDRFKAFNDAHGHLEGDRLLAEIAAAWKAELRGNDVVGRFGGEEFLLLLPGVDGAVANAVVERLRAAMPVAATCSFGVATWDGEEPASSLLARADVALYRAKTAGRNRVVVG